jgi:hypothetical protein
MCGEDHDGERKNEENWDGWVDGELVAPKGPIPADWPSSDDLGKLLVRNTIQQRYCTIVGGKCIRLYVNCSHTKKNLSM